MGVSIANMLKDFIPKMHGSWSIWLASTALGAGLADSISFQVIVALIASLFLLFSIQPAHIILTGKQKDAKLYIPIAGFIASVVFLLFISPSSYEALLPYAIVFLFLAAVRNNLKAYAAVGAIALTLSAPLLYSATGYSVRQIIVPWTLFILLSLWAVSLAEDALFSKKIRYSPFPLATFAAAALLYAPVKYSMAITAPAVALEIATPLANLKTKYLGLSLLGTELYFVALTAMTFRT